MNRICIELSDTQTILKLNDQKQVLPQVKDRMRSYLTINCLVLLALWASEMPIRMRLLIAINTIFLSLESLVLHATIKKALLDAQTMLHAG